MDRTPNAHLARRSAAYAMKIKTPDELRSSFLAFFESKAHRIVASSPVIPEGDPTLLFTNAGMNQFKDTLLGLEKRDYVRAASAQKCIRAGGKHNDLDEVGRDGRHLTFFEMLGNWSFGEYYKRESLKWGWEYITQVLGLDPARLYVSVYKTDDESWEIWNKDIGLSPDRIVRLGDVENGDDENFWSMGPTGPCGPSSEIYYDHHPELGPTTWAPGFDGERYVEIWNHVFMEHNRSEDGTLTPLPMQSVDTGMGLERVACLLAGVDNVFQTDVFTPIIAWTHRLLRGENVDPRSLFGHPKFTEYCVIADHVRTITFSICDGARFSNEGRGYVLRRILRRAVRHGRNLGFTEPFLFRVAEVVVERFQHVYPELRLKQREAQTIIRAEEERFFRTIDRGMALFDEVAQKTVAGGSSRIDGDSVFKLYDTFGFPPDLTRIMAEERRLTIDEAGYEVAMERQRERSRSADDRYETAGEWNILNDGAADTFVGYDHLQVETEVLRYRVDGSTGTVEICLRATPFYAESGGQVGDRGIIETLDGRVALEVVDTQKTVAGITHIANVIDGTVSAEALRGGVRARVDGHRRTLTASNHTATHLLHAALHRFVSASAFQAGSLVDGERLRFDFSYDKPVTDEQIAAIERWVNDRVRDAIPVTVHRDVPLADAETMGAMMIFGEKYGEKVRVIELAGTSTELCGGTHVRNTSDIAYFRVVSEGGVAAGVRRIEAVTNERAFELAETDRQRLVKATDLLRTTPADLADRIEKLLATQKETEKRLAELQRVKAKLTADELVARATSRGGLKFVAARIEAGDRDELLAVADFVRDRLGENGAALLATVLDEKPALVALVTDGAVKAYGLKAGDLVNAAASVVGGKGGGKPTLAQAGGRDVEQLGAAVAAFVGAIEQRVAG